MMAVYKCLQTESMFVEIAKKENFSKSYRFNDENVQWLMDFLSDFRDTQGGEFSSLTKLKIFLRQLANPVLQFLGGRSAVEEIAVRQITVCKIHFIQDLMKFRS